MRIFIVEDDINIIKILEKIIMDRDLGAVIGYSQDGLKGLQEIQFFKPDITLVDLFMPSMNGIALVNKAKEKNSDIQFVMISQVTSKELIGKAYDSGIEYYIHKPVNAKEVESVIKKVIDKIEVNRTLSQIKNLFTKKISVTKGKVDADFNKNIKRVMQRIGILGESGSQDVLKVTKYLLESGEDMSNLTIKELCKKFSENPRSMEQKIRRTATVGMINLANLGIEDYMNEVFVKYSNSLYNFEQVKKQMDYIRKKGKDKGKVNLKKFLNGMVFYSSEQ